MIPRFSLANFQYLWIFLTVFSCFIVLSGCGSSSVVLDPNYENKAIQTREFKRENIKIVNVVDNREDKSYEIGTAHTGMFNKKTPYVLKVSVEEFVGKILDSVMTTTATKDRYTPITVFVDTFQVGEDIGLF